MRTLPPAFLFAVILAGACTSSPEEAATVPEASPTEPQPAAGTGPEESLPAPFRDARAEAVVRAMADALMKAGTFSVHVEAWSDEETADGSIHSLPADTRFMVRRPDGLFAERTSEKGQRKCWYDGKSFTVLDVGKNLFARIDAPATLEETVDLLADRYGVVMPLADLLADDPAESYGGVADRVEYLGTQSVRGTPCHHIAYEAPWLRWQVWIAAEGDPLPRRVQITYSDEPGDPRFLAYLDEWKLGAAAESSVFAFAPPDGAREIELAPRESGTDEDR